MFSLGATLRNEQTVGEKSLFHSKWPGEFVSVNAACLRQAPYTSLRDGRVRMESINEMGQMVRVRHGYQIQYADPLSVRAGEGLTVGRADNDFPGWRWCRGTDGRQGWVPVEFLSSQESQTTILQDYSARELHVVAGEEVTVEDTRHGWLLVRNVKGDRGWIPADCL